MPLVTNGWEPFVQFNFELEYQKGHDNTVVDVLSHVTTWLDPDMVRSILDGVAFGAVHWAEAHDPAMVESDHHLEQEVCVATGCAQVQMHVMDWAKAQREDKALSAVLYWLGTQKKTDLKALLASHASSKEDLLILWNWQNLWFIREPYTFAQGPRVRPKIYYYL